MSLNISNAGIAYELIEGDYYFGKYGPLNVVIHSKSGYPNATKLLR